MFTVEIADGAEVVRKEAAPRVRNSYKGVEVNNENLVMQRKMDER